MQTKFTAFNLHAKRVPCLRQFLAVAKVEDFVYC